MVCIGTGWPADCIKGVFAPWSPWSELESKRVAMTVASYFATLCLRLPCESERVFFKDVQFDDGSQPLRNKCHDNVDAWTTRNPQYRAVKGWAISGCVLDAHSVVCDEHGILWDITFPDLASRGILFIRHHGTEEEFMAREQAPITIRDPLRTS
jgi:hypothetical protein